ncbi:MAG: DUF1080 domain-containing protein [Planctomycetes bacterium]|nr:DUF1080 domain-containing protein [Planctomycetota bacterium]
MEPMETLAGKRVLFAPGQLCVLFGAWFLIPALSAAEAKQTPRVVPLKRVIERRCIFNGKDLTGWTVFGANRWTVEEGELIGKGAKGLPGWLIYPICERETTISLEFKLVGDGAGGIAVRIPPMAEVILPEPPFPREFPSRVSVGGFVASIAPPSERLEPTGTIIGLSRAYPPSPTKHAAPFMFPGEWNHMMVMATRDLIRVCLNGYVVADAFDPQGTSGHLGLRLPDAPGAIRFRNITLAIEHLPPSIVQGLSRIPPLEVLLDSPTQEWLNLGRDEMLALGSDGLLLVGDSLVTRTPPSSPTPYVLSKHDYASFFMTFDVFLGEDGDARVAFGIRSGDEGGTGLSRYEVALNCLEGDDVQDPGGSICGLARAYTGALAPDRWNRCAIYRLGNEITVYVNQRRTAYLWNTYRVSKTADGPSIPRRAMRGRIGFRVLTGKVQFRNLQIKRNEGQRLPLEPGAQDRK